mgnify:CR=1 FL=1
MIVWYDVIDSKQVKIDFDLDNLEYYMQQLFAADFVEYDNEGVAEEIQEGWEKWFEENFGENWDEV